MSELDNLLVWAAFYLAGLLTGRRMGTKEGG